MRKLWYILYFSFQVINSILFNPWTKTDLHTSFLLWKFWELSMKINSITRGKWQVLATLRERKIHPSYVSAQPFKTEDNEDWINKWHSYRKGKMIEHFLKSLKKITLWILLKVCSVLDSAFCFLHTVMLTMQTNERV